MALSVYPVALPCDVKNLLQFSRILHSHRPALTSTNPFSCACANAHAISLPWTAAAASPRSCWCWLRPLQKACSCACCSGGSSLRLGRRRSATSRSPRRGAAGAVARRWRHNPWMARRSSDCWVCWNSAMAPCRSITRRCCGGSKGCSTSLVFGMVDHARPGDASWPGAGGRPRISTRPHLLFRVMLALSNR